MGKYTTVYRKLSPRSIHDERGESSLTVPILPFSCTILLFEKPIVMMTFGTGVLVSLGKARRPFYVYLLLRQGCKKTEGRMWGQTHAPLM